MVPAAVLSVYFLAGLAVMFVPGLTSGFASRLSVVLTIGLLVGLLSGLVVAAMAKRQGAAGTVAMTSPGSSAFDTALASLRLAIRHKTPFRLIPFLEDARHRHLLRTVGPVYQFRHATLQDRLAQPAAESITAERSSRFVDARQR